MGTDGDAREGARPFRASDTGLLGITWRLLSQGPCRTLPRVGWRPGSAPYLRPADVRRQLATELGLPAAIMRSSPRRLGEYL